MVLALLMASLPNVTHAQGTPAASGAAILQCEGSEPTCEGDGVLVEFLASGESPGMNRSWSMARVTLQPEALVQPAGSDTPTHYTVYVEAGTVGLTASSPITCAGECQVEELLPDTTPVALPAGGTHIPAGTEVLLSAGDVATFERTDESTHTYRNAGETDAKLVSSLLGPSLSVRCRGRCLDGF